MVDLPDGFQIVEEFDIGNIDDVKEEARPLIPPTKDVKVQIKRVSANKSKGNLEEGIPEASYRWLNLGLQLVDGIGEEGKFKGAYVSSDIICYYADPTYYPKSTGEQKGLFYGKLADLQRATGTVGKKVNDSFVEEITDKIILCNIEQVKDRNGEKMNVAKFFKALPTSMQV